MTDSVGAGSGGGIHPGAPIIWPEGKSSAQQVQQAQQAQQAGKASAVPAQSAKDAAATSQIAQQAQQAMQQARPTVARTLSKADVSAQLVQLGLAASKENIQLANKMLMNGLELSSDNFKTLFGLMKGTGDMSASQQSAMLALSKGLQNEPGAMRSLEQFFTQNPQMAKQMQGMQAMINTLMAAFTSGKNLFSPALMTQLSSLLINVDDKFKKMLSGDLSKDKLAELFTRSGLLGDVSALRSLFQGLAKQLGDIQNPQLRESAQKLLTLLRNFNGQADELLQNITAQAVLSKPNVRPDAALPDKYAYWQIPNAMAKNPDTIDILIKRDDNKKEAPVNPNKTRIILKLNTDKLGEMTIIIDVEEKNIWYIFNNDSEEAKQFVAANTATLRDRMNQLNWDVKGLQSIIRRVDVKKFLVPTIDLDKLKRISTEV